MASRKFVTTSKTSCRC